MPSALLFFLFSCIVIVGAHSLTFSAPLVHRFSDEARAAVAPGRAVDRWPSRRSPEYYEVLARSDRLRQRRRLGGARYSMLYPAEGSETYSPGNDFGWLHYTWVDVGSPNVSFLVALDAGSDLFWVPCDCIQCAPLSGYHGSLVPRWSSPWASCCLGKPCVVSGKFPRGMEVSRGFGKTLWDKELGMYNPDESKTSKHLSCSHELCTLGGGCESTKQPCPYTVSYYSENTSTSGLLVEDALYLATTDDHTIVQAPVIIGCGRKQSGGYLDGVAPDGLLGLGFGKISVPSILARAGLARNSFSMCFRGDESGRIFFGDQGVSTQHTTPFVALNGKYVTYIVELENFCIGTQCLEKTRFQALVDSGSSFTFLPDDVYKRVALEFDRQINASRLDYEGSPWEYCYSANSLEMPDVPAVMLTFSVNKSFEVSNPIFSVYDKQEDVLAGFCLALQSSAETLATIGQNFMTGYHMVFDRENLKLGWSRSDCHNLDSSKRVPLSPPPRDRPENPLPTNQQHSSPNGKAVSPAIAGRAPSIPSAASSKVVTWFHFLFMLLTQFPYFCWIVVWC